MAKILKKDALDYHSMGRPGKIQVVPTKPYATQRDLSLAYSPGVAEPCLEIQKNPDDAYRYTTKGNLVAVISNGTAVLGLGDIGALAGKPVMEGKGLLFKIFADIDVFDIEVDETDVDKFVQTVKAIAPTFGGINLEDIKAPECFEIEERLKAELDIPLMHDDQHGTAIISNAGLLNALELCHKKLEDVVIVVHGAGASAIACTKLCVSLGANTENIIMIDSKGVIRTDRTDLNKYKQLFATTRNVFKLEDAIKNADVFLGLSVADILTQDMVRSMAKDPIVFALANPNPEISYEEAIAAREDIIVATGRSDYPNQINNVLGFPFIFRGALDVKSKTINEAMKIAAVKAIAELAKEEVPDTVSTAYKTMHLGFGKEYIIPKPLDPRLITRVAPAVAKAAIDSGVARHIITDWDAYKTQLEERLGLGNKLIRAIHEKAKQSPKRVLLSDAHHYRVLKAAQEAKNEGIAIPILLGDEIIIRRKLEEYEIDLGDVKIIDPRAEEEDVNRQKYAHILHEKRQRKGVMYEEALESMYHRAYYGSAMVEAGDADAFISGFSTKYPDSIRPAIELIGTKTDLNHIAGMYMMLTQKGTFFFADTTVNIRPNAQTLVDTTLLVAEAVRRFNFEPRIAMISYSNFGSKRSGSPSFVHDAVTILHRDHPNLIVDGEMQANFALNKEMRMKKFPFTKLGDKDVNTLIFPGLSSGNIAYKIMQEIGEAEAVGPILLGLKKSIHVVQIESTVREIVNMIAIAVVDAQ